ncbi:MAG: hypothetical protein ACKOTZ_04605 [Chloroflexota bacterium]
MPVARSVRRPLAAALLALAVLAPAALRASAATLPPQPPCSVTNQRTTNAVSSLASAVAGATGGDTLLVSGFCRGVAVTIDKDLTIRGVATGGYLRGVLTGTGRDSVLRIPAGRTVTLELLRISGGNVRDTSLGGGITNAGTLTLDRVTVRRNVAVFGGGIRTSGPLTLVDTVITRNLGLDFGGGLAVTSTGSVTMTGWSELRANVAGNGAGAWVAGSISIADDSRLFYNKAGRTAKSPWKSSYGFAGYGGAIFLEGSMTMSGDAFITLNIAQSRAGAIYWSNKPIVGTWCDLPWSNQNRTKPSGDPCISGAAKA